MNRIKKIIVMLCLFLLPSVVNAVGSETHLEVEYKKIFNIDIPDGYIGVQGMIITKDFFVVAVIKSDNTETALLKYDKNTFKAIGEPVVNNKLGHANDMAYSKEKDEIYVVEKNQIIVLDSASFLEKNIIDLPFECEGIDLDKDHYYLKDAKSLYVFDKDFQQLYTFSIEVEYSRQGISKHGDYFYHSLFVPYEGSSWEKGSSLVRIYDLNGKLTNTHYTTAGYGELQATEFDEDIPYLLFQGENGQSAIYTPKYLTTSNFIEVTDTTEDTNASAILADEAGTIEKITVRDGKYSFSPILYIEPGNYKYTITKFESEFSQDIIIHAAVEVSYNVVKNILETSVIYDQEGFTEIVEKIPDEVIETPINPGESSNELLEQGTVENPQTGNYFPFYILPIILGAGLVFVLFKRKFFFKL